VATGQASRAAVFAALLARAGMEGPHLPFEGKAGWCKHVAREDLVLGSMGGENAAPFKIGDTRIKFRPCGAIAIASVIAAEKVTPIDIREIDRATVETFDHAKIVMGTGEHRWNPDSREVADHSVPYVVAATLMDGTLTLRSFDDAHLFDPEMRALMKKIEVVENKEFTKLYRQQPVEH